MARKKRQAGGKRAKASAGKRSNAGKSRRVSPRKGSGGGADAAPKMGRPTKYRPEFVERAREMCRRGATDYDLAQEFGVVTSTIWSWSVKHPDFSSALKTEKGAFDDRVERSLAQRAVGYSYHATKVMQHNGTPVYAAYIEHVPPDPGAAKLWLCNRRPDLWREKVELGGKDGAGIPIEISDENAYDLARRMMLIMSLASRASKGDGGQGAPQ